MHETIIDAAPPSLAPAVIFPHDEALRLRCLALLDGGRTISTMSRASGVSASILSQYLSAKGNLYCGDTEKYERKLSGWLERLDLETLAGIPTIATPVAEKIAKAARMVRRCHIMGKGIGRAGIGKTRGAALLCEADESTMLILASREEGTREAVRARLFKLAGVRGPRKRTANRRRLMYSELVNRLRGTEILIVVDQAHKLTAPAIDLLVELWNATAAPQLWLGTSQLEENLERDEQWGSRLAFTFPIEVIVDKERNDVRPLVQHQIKARLPELNGELPRLTNLCEKLALTGSFRRVEMRLATMLYLHESARNKDTSWCELFEQSAAFLTEQEDE